MRLIPSCCLFISASNDRAEQKLSQEMEESMIEIQSDISDNIIQNHDFSDGLHSWKFNCCDGYIASDDSGRIGGIQGTFVVVTHRKESWHGLEQDITSRIWAGNTYKLSAVVGASGALQGCCEIQATLRLEYHDFGTKYLSIGRVRISKEQWEMMDGVFSLLNMPKCVVFYLEGPPGVDLLVKSVRISKSEGHCSEGPFNIIQNHDFSDGLNFWHLNCCKGHVAIDPSSTAGVIAKSCSNIAIITGRQESWHGLEQDITSKVAIGCSYKVLVEVSASGDFQSSDIQATLRLHESNSKTEYSCLARASVPRGKFEILEGSFSLSTMPKQVIFYVEGPPPGIDLLVKSASITTASMSVVFEEGGRIAEDSSTRPASANIIMNPDFANGVEDWSGRGCEILLKSDGTNFASTRNRIQTWNGIEQEITLRVRRKYAYQATANIRISGGNTTTAEVRLTLYVKISDIREEYIGIGTVQANKVDWVQIQEKFLINASPEKVIIYLEGPPPGTDIHLKHLEVIHAPAAIPVSPPVINDPCYGVNIVENSSLSNGLGSWFGLGNCSLRVQSGSPRALPPMAEASLGAHEPLSGRYICATNRTQNWMGPAQMITEKIKLFLTYQVSAWVRVGEAPTPQDVNLALAVDGQWVNAGQVEVGDGRWYEIGGSFRVEKQPEKVMLYAQGPLAGCHLMLAGLHVFAVDRRRRFKHLKKKTDKLRKRDVVLKLSGARAGNFSRALVRIKQINNSFPLGSCINRTNMDNEDFNEFFVDHFNWAVFGNELKWYWTEADRGKFNYRDADELLNFCRRNKIETRGHCIFWEVESMVQPWVKSLDNPGLKTAVENRLTGLLARYQGMFKHYDVNNEMLHGSFYRDRLGENIRPTMFTSASRLDPSATLFVNDYHVEDGCDPRSSPEKYIRQVLDLQAHGAPVGGIGVQGHIDNPVGPIICSALDKLGVLGLPVWFTEMDVSSANDYVRADDLEVMLREAFAHPAVDGVVLWGFWELFCRRDAHLVNAEGKVNEAGKRLIALRREWLSSATGCVDDELNFGFRGFQGTYVAEFVTESDSVSKTFLVEDGMSPLVVSVEI